MWHSSRWCLWRRPGESTKITLTCANVLDPVSADGSSPTTGTSSSPLSLRISTGKTNTQHSNFSRSKYCSTTQGESVGANLKAEGNLCWFACLSSSFSSPPPPYCQHLLTPSISQTSFKKWYQNSIAL